MQKISLWGTASAWQFTGDETNAAEMRKLTLPTGEVTVQEANELNDIEARCYVPVTWGTHILKPGDWIVLMDSGIVITFTEKQMPHMVQIQTLYEQRAGLLGAPEATEEATQVDQGKMLVATFSGDPEPLVRERLAYVNEKHRTDWELEVQHDLTAGVAEYFLTIAATGRELGRWKTGDTVNVYADGTVEVEPVQADS